MSLTMGDTTRQAFLLKAQNPDGGWGYFPGRASWLEPTAWAALALHGHPAAERAYRTVRAWQNSDGSARPQGSVSSTHWSGALLVILAALRRDKPVVERGVEYLLGTVGVESGPLMRVLHFLDPERNDREPKFEGWPWRAGAAAWIEPTAHSITALRVAKQLLPPSPHIDARIDSAQKLIWHQRCRGGGWNYGARIAREVSLAPFPETTAVALLGLVGTAPERIRESIEMAKKLAAGDPSPVTHAWLTLGLRLHGQEVTGPEPPPLGNDIMVAAIAELGAAGGPWRLLKDRLPA